MVNRRYGVTMRLLGPVGGVRHVDENKLIALKDGLQVQD
jgi:hypothetical protein